MGAASKEQRREHLETCTFKKISCPRKNCNFEGTPKEFFEHWNNIHVKGFIHISDFEECKGNSLLFELTTDCFQSVASIVESGVFLYIEDNVIAFNFVLRKEGRRRELFHDLRIQQRIFAKNSMTKPVWTKCDLSLFYNEKGTIRKGITSSNLEDINTCPFTETSACDDLINTNGAYKIRCTITAHTVECVEKCKCLKR